MKRDVSDYLEMQVLIKVHTPRNDLLEFVKKNFNFIQITDRLFDSVVLFL